MKKKILLFVGFILIDILASTGINSIRKQQIKEQQEQLLAVKVRHQWYFDCPNCGYGIYHTECGAWKPADKTCSNCGATGSWRSIDCILP